VEDGKTADGFGWLLSNGEGEPIYVVQTLTSRCFMLEVLY
jgi:hypothetical protein